MSFQGFPHNPLDALKGIKEGQERRGPNGIFYVVSTIDRLSGSVRLLVRGSSTRAIVVDPETVHEQYPEVEKA